jgi:hypothetical protein
MGAHTPTLLIIALFTEKLCGLDEFEKIRRHVKDSILIVSQKSLKNDVVISYVFMASERFNYEQSPLLSKFRREGVTV